MIEKHQIKRKYIEVESKESESELEYEERKESKNEEQHKIEFKETTKTKKTGQKEKCKINIRIPQQKLKKCSGKQTIMCNLGQTVSLFDSTGKSTATDRTASDFYNAIEKV